MKKFLITVGLLVLMACAVGWVLNYQSLGTTQDTLQETQADLHDVQVKLQDTANSLEETQDELQDTTENLENTQQSLENTQQSLENTQQSLEETQQSLEETQQSLEEQKSETQKYTQLYEDSLEELQNREEELETVTDELNASEQLNEGLQKTLDEVQEQLALYEDTLGVKVFSGVMPPYSSGNITDIVLTSQSTAENPTWEQLKAFLREDKTDKNLYISGAYECGNYAQDLHNNAEAQGIRAAFVAVHFHNDKPHAINAFKTLDKGLVYIDVTGNTRPISLANLDKEVTLEKDKRYRSSLLFPNGWLLTPDDREVKSIEIYW
jgi:myosin heavy subunit